MEDSLIKDVQKVPTIKERLLLRFFAAKTIVGKNWKKDLSKNDSFFATFEGSEWISSVSKATSNPKFASADRVERVTIALEKLANIKLPPIC